MSIRELSDLLDPDTFKTMVEDLRATEGEVLPAERSGAERTAAAAARALSNLLLLWSQGSHTLANTILGTVQRRVLGKDAESVDSVIVEGMEDTLKLLRDNTGPQGVTAREVLLAGCIPKGKDLGDDAPRLVKPKAPHTHSLQAVAQRLGVNVDRLHAAARRKAHWQTGDPNVLYTYSPDYTPTTNRAFTAEQKQAIRDAYTAPDITHPSANQKTGAGAGQHPQPWCPSGI